MGGRELPTSVDELSVDLLNDVLAEHTPGVALRGFDVVEVKEWGKGDASTAARFVIRPDYSAASPTPLPRQIAVKAARPAVAPGYANRRTGPIYANEVGIYTKLRPWELLEAPRALGGTYDADSQTFLLLLEDLRERGATFPKATNPISMECMHALLEVMATLHAHYWDSPQLTRSLAWMETHQKGGVFDFFNKPEIAPAWINHLVETIQFKREMVERLGTTVDGLYRGTQLVQRHQATLPQTVCHGDMHIGNIYFLPGDKAGLLDWQLTSQGFAMHDVSYIITTSLSVAERRQHERELLHQYRELLIAKGAHDAPSLETLWLEYRRAMVWGVYIGWLTTPVDNYGWEVSVMSHLRVMTAYEDLETGKIIDAMS